jgi:hypothetical protein
MIFGTVSASDRTAPVHGEQPSERACGTDQRRPLAGQQRHRRLLQHEQGSCRGRRPRAPWRSERHDGNVFGVDAQMSISVQFESGKTRMLSARPEAAVQQVPELGPLMLGIPLTLGVPQREDALLRA